MTHDAPIVRRLFATTCDLFCAQAFVGEVLDKARDALNPAWKMG